MQGKAGVRATGVVMSRRWGVKREQALPFSGSQPDPLEENRMQAETARRNPPDDASR